MAEALITVRITPTVERDFELRGVFPELRTTDAPLLPNGSRLDYFQVTPERAREVLADAEARRLDSTAPKGTPKSFTALANALRCALNMDPRPEVAARRVDAEARNKRWRTREALARVAELDAQAAAEEERLRALPSEVEFRKLAHAFVWRMWTGFELTFVRTDGNLTETSGFRFSGAARDVLLGYVHSMMWAIDCDIDVVLDTSVRYGKRDQLRAKAAAMDPTLQLCLGAAKAGQIPGVELEGDAA